MAKSTSASPKYSLVMEPVLVDAGRFTGLLRGDGEDVRLGEAARLGGL
jgi:hypothetical protein